MYNVKFKINSERGRLEFANEINGTVKRPFVEIADYLIYLSEQMKKYELVKITVEVERNEVQP